MKLIQTRDVRKYKPILEGLLDDFGYDYWHSILAWCKIVKDTDRRFWQVFLITERSKVIGICGLYSLHHRDDTEQLWLGWFGILPELRNRKFGEKALAVIEQKARKVGCNRLFSYVDKGGRPLSFYYRNGFKYVSTVQDYLSSCFACDPNDFSSKEDHVISKELR